MRLALAALSLLALTPAACQIPQPESVVAAEVEFDVASAMMRMMQMATPGEQHAGLMALAGDWDVKFRYRMGVDAPWSEADATMKQQKAVGGRWLIGKWSGTLEGMPFDGLQIMGYNNLAGAYESHWLDSMSTWMVSSSGGYDAQGALVLQGSMVDVITPQGRPYRSVTTFQDADHYRTVMFDTIPPAGEVAVMEMEFTRRM